MELRVLQYFLAVAREQSISAAADYLHLTQPTLSRQLKDLEDELGCQLLIRGSRRITLTEQGMLLRKRAEEILELVHKAEGELNVHDEVVSGTISIGAGETDAARLLARIARDLHAQHPGIRFDIVSGDRLDILERLDKGLLDFAVLLGDVDAARYDLLPLPASDTWGLLLRRDHPLAARETITPDDLRSEPLLVSRQAMTDSVLTDWLGGEPLNIVATYNLIYNASIMVEEGMGSALTLDKLINVTGESPLCFRPLTPRQTINMHILWKKYQIFSRPAELFMEAVREVVEAGETLLFDKRRVSPQPPSEENR